MSTFLLRRPFWRPDQPQPVYTTIVDQTVASWAPVFAAERAATRSPDRPTLDVRPYAWSPSFTWVRPVVDAQVASWIPAFTSELASTRSPAPRGLDLLREVPDPAFGWIVSTFTPASTVAQQWPAILQAAGISYRSADKGQLDVRGQDWAPAFNWVQPVVDATLATWSPIFAAQRASERLRDRTPWKFWDEWAPEPAWIFSSLAAVTVAQTWPAILQATDQSYRSRDRATLDVRGYAWSPQFGWISRPVDQTLASWAPIWALEASSQRSAAPPPLDVRGFESGTAFTGVQQVVNAIVARWAAIWAEELGSLRSRGPAPLDVRLTPDQPQQGPLAFFGSTIIPVVVTVLARNLITTDEPTMGTHDGPITFGDLGG